MERNTGGILAGAVVSTIIFILLIATLAVVTFLVWLKKRQKWRVREINADDDSTSLSGINNIVYQSNTMPINGPELGIGFSNALYEGKLFFLIIIISYDEIEQIIIVNIQYIYKTMHIML